MCINKCKMCIIKKCYREMRIIKISDINIAIILSVNLVRFIPKMHHITYLVLSFFWTPLG